MRCLYCAVYGKGLRFLSRKYCDRYFTMNEAYSNRELDEKFTSLQDSMEVHLDEQNKTLSRIEVQTTKTNGQVAAITKWKEQVMGGAKVAIPVLMILIAVMGWFAVDYLNHRNKTASTDQIQAAVAAGIQQALQNYKNNN